MFCAPVVFALNALKPTAVSLDPVVFSYNALKPKALLLEALLSFNA